jgi:curli biogenesis system outer membrane secretion channel CsgG
MKRLIFALAVVATMLCAGCGGKGGFGGKNPDDYVKPTIAVMKFENRAGFPLNWALGDGMQEILVDRLLKTGRYHVVERQELASVAGELQLQQSGATRPQGKVAAGRIKNCQYLIKGAVTDFGHVSAKAAGVSAWHWDLAGGSNRAVMGIVLYVIEVESGEIIASENIEESVSAQDLSVKAAYEGLSFGGTTFYQTPLGRATAKVVDRAIKRITLAIASRPWEPQVALVQADGSVVVSGGRDRGVRRGAEFEVLDIGPPILDPVTGDEIGRSPGRRVGRVIVQDVSERYSTATIVIGRAADFKPGQACRTGG